MEGISYRDVTAQRRSSPNFDFGAPIPSFFSFLFQSLIEQDFFSHLVSISAWVLIMIVTLD